MTDLHQANPAADALAVWTTVLSAKIDESEPIAHWLGALDHAFGYTCYAQGEVKQAELDDLATRRRAWEKAESFCRHDQKIRAAYRYSVLEVSKGGVLAELRGKLQGLGDRKSTRLNSSH